MLVDVVLAQRGFRLSQDPIHPEDDGALNTIVDMPFRFKC
jgi:hypothetical protein